MFAGRYLSATLHPIHPAQRGRFHHRSRQFGLREYWYAFTATYIGLQTFAFFYGLFTFDKSAARLSSNYGTPDMNRLIGLVCGIVFLINPHTLLAQGRRGQGANTAPRPTGVSSTDNFKDFKRAIALQATDRQSADFWGRRKTR
jgi:hypothetical protein